MAWEKVTALRQRHRDLEDQIRATEADLTLAETDYAHSGREDSRLIAEVAAMKEACDQLRDELTSLLNGRAVKVITDVELLQDANSIAYRLVNARRQITTKIRRAVAMG